MCLVPTLSGLLHKLTNLIKFYSYNCVVTLVFFFMGNKFNPVDFFNLTAQLVERLGLTGWCYLRYQKCTLFKG